MRLESVQGIGNAKSASQQEEWDWQSWKKSKKGKKRRKSKRDSSSSGTEYSFSSSESSWGKKGRKKERKRQKGNQLQLKVLRELQGVTQFATEEPRQNTPRRRPSRGAQCERAEPREEPLELVPERRVAEAPTTQVAQVSDHISPACKDMLELRTNGVLDTEKIKT